ncbi:aldehyde dehydrogenase family protein [Nocardia sp. R6R-6]|uniref:aldehyde dehydrogenase family protein n=1 Tax=Nocardia sp. R6R-6 TaxID=3459303 RepID=UPI00403DCEAC
MANESHYGLAAYLWCNDLNCVLAAAGRVESGWIQVNEAGGQVVGQSYGGLKQSSIGREGVFARRHARGVHDHKAGQRAHRVESGRPEAARWEPPTSREPGRWLPASRP